MKKIGGGSNICSEESLKTGDYIKHAINFADKIKKQIEEISPEIIICFSPDIYRFMGQYIYPYNGVENCYHYEGKIIVKGYHPAASKSIEEYFVKPVNSCIKQILNLRD